MTVTLGSMARAARIAAVCAAAALVLLPVAPARADDIVRPPRMDKPPAGYRLTGNQAAAIADRSPKIVALRRKHPGAFSNVFEKSGLRWQVSYYERDPPNKEIGQVYVSDVTGRITEAWTGPQVAWTMARGYAGAFGRKINSPWVWIPLALLFVVPFVDPRRPLRVRHLDLLVLMAFGVSVAFFNDANIDVSVPLAYPLLLYLLGRALWIGLRGRPREALRPLVPISWLLVGLLFLMGFRVGLNIADSNVIDVGYAGVIGANRIAHGEPLWGNFPKDNEHGDTYGPINYAAYVPFERVMPWSGKWDSLPAAHAAAIFFDLLCLGLIFLIGRQLRGPPLGVTLAYAWAANPFTLYAMNCNVNDALVGALVLGAIVVATRPAGRGALIGLAGMAKFAPLGLAPLFARHTRGSALRTAIGLAAALVPCLVLVLAYGGLHAFYDRTLGFQASRGSPFSVWGLYDWTAPQAVVQAGAAILAVALAFVPRRRDVVGLSALCAAVLIALQLGVTHWFYLYLVWFLGPLLVALLADGEPDRRAVPLSYVEELGKLPAPAVAWR